MIMTIEQVTPKKQKKRLKKPKTKPNQTKTTTTKPHGKIANTMINILRDVLNNCVDLVNSTFTLVWLSLCYQQQYIGRPLVQTPEIPHAFTCQLQFNVVFPYSDTTCITISVAIQCNFSIFRDYMHYGISCNSMQFYHIQRLHALRYHW